MNIKKHSIENHKNMILIKNLNVTFDLSIHFLTGDDPAITHSVRINQKDMLDIARTIIKHYSK